MRYVHCGVSLDKEIHFENSNAFGRQHAGGFSLNPATGGTPAQGTKKPSLKNRGSPSLAVTRERVTHSKMSIIADADSGLTSYRQINSVVVQGLLNSSLCLLIRFSKRQAGIAHRKAQAIQSILDRDRIGHDKQGVYQG